MTRTAPPRGSLPAWPSARPEATAHEETASSPRPATGWTTIVWDDPVNLMSYVTHVFMAYFGFPRDVAHELMLRVHNEGRAVVAHGDLETMERHVIAMHVHGLLATVGRGEE